MKILSLFSGIGGFDLAFQNKGHTIIGACEIDKYARSVYSRHFPGVKIYQDATKINPEELEDFDCLCAGFPCQTFSIAGKRLGFEESRGTLFLKLLGLQDKKDLDFCYLKTLKDYYLTIEGKHLQSFSQHWMSSGMMQNGRCSIANILFHKTGRGSTLSDILEENPDPKIFPIGENTEGNNSSRYKTQKDGSRIRDEITGSVQTSPTNGAATMIVGAIDANYHKGGGTRTMIGWSKSTRDWGVEQRFKIGEANTLNTGEGCRNQSTCNYVIQKSRVRRLTL